MSRGYCGFAASLMELDRIGLSWIANANANSSLVLWPRMSIEVINTQSSCLFAQWKKKAVDWGERRDDTASPCGMRVWRTWSTWHGLGPNVRQPSVVVVVPNTVSRALTSTYRPRADGHLVVCFFVHRSRIRNPVLLRSPNCQQYDAPLLTDMVSALFFNLISSIFDERRGAFHTETARACETLKRQRNKPRRAKTKKILIGQTKKDCGRKKGKKRKKKKRSSGLARFGTSGSAGWLAAANDVQGWATGRVRTRTRTINY
ncbi:hypothetical protein V8C43DRAFT_102409 [Trichoderma afarasin]